MKVAQTVVALVLVVIGGRAMADPASTLKYLAAEPATLLDLGVFRLEALMDEVARHPGMQLEFSSGTETPIITTTYDAKDQRILIQANYEFSKPHSIDEQTLRKHLKEKILLLKMRLGINPEEGVPFMNASILLTAFSHQQGDGNVEFGDDLSPALKRRASDIDRITQVAARVGIRTRCSSSLTAVEIECSGSGR